MSEATRRRRVGLLLGSFGVAFAVFGLVLWFVSVRPRTAELNRAVLGIVAHVLFGYVVVTSGLVFLGEESAATREFLATKWCLGGATFLGGLVIWGALPEFRSGAITLGTLQGFAIVGTVGAAAGILIGLNRGRTGRNGRFADRTDDREETLVFLLRLLEHDVRNHVIAISNHADSIRPSTFDPSPTPSEAIDDRAASIERLLDTASVVIESEADDGGFDAIDVGAVLREQLAVVRSDSPTVEIEVDLEDHLYVECDRFVGELFGNILENAVVHNAPAELTVSVTATELGDAVEIEIADDGGGIPPEIREELFEPGVHAHGSPGDGIGLYLVGRLVDAYGGHISVSDRSPSGTRFRLRFPRARPDTETR